VGATVVDAPMAACAAMVPPLLRLVLGRAHVASAASGGDMALALPPAFARARASSTGVDMTLPQHVAQSSLVAGPQLRAARGSSISHPSLHVALSVGSISL